MSKARFRWIPARWKPVLFAAQQSCCKIRLEQRLPPDMVIPPPDLL